MGAGRGVGGTVTAISGSTITIKTEDGDTYQVLTSANSHIMKRVDRQPEPVKITDIHVGDAVMAGGEVDAKAKTVGAVFVMVLTPEQAAQAKKMREDFGKTWTAGEVTAIKDLDITIKRRDGVTQTVSVDENTSFKKRDDSITLADIQVGDMLRATGALKGSSFLADDRKRRADGRPRRSEQGRGPRAGTAPAATAPGDAAIGEQARLATYPIDFMNLREQFAGWLVAVSLSSVLVGASAAIAQTSPATAPAASAACAGTALDPDPARRRRRTPEEPSAARSKPATSRSPESASPPPTRSPERNSPPPPTSPAPTR